MIPPAHEIYSSLELIALQSQLQAEALQQRRVLALTYEPCSRKPEFLQHIVVAFGSYDPLTLAHEAMFVAAQEAVQQQHQGAPEEATEVLVVSSTAHYEKRIDLCKNSSLPDRLLALENTYAPRARASVGIFNNPYFVHLAPQVQQAFPNADLTFVMGTDVLEKIADKEEQQKRGFNPEEIFASLFQHHFLVADREYTSKGKPLRLVTLEILLQENGHLQPYAGKIISLQGSLSSLGPLSSTLVREKVSKKEPFDDLVNQKTAAFIRRWNLYLPNNHWYEASAYARERFVDTQGNIQKWQQKFGSLLDFFKELEQDKALQQKTIAERGNNFLY